MIHFWSDSQPNKSFVRSSLCLLIDRSVRMDRIYGDRVLHYVFPFLHFLLGLFVISYVSMYVCMCICVRMLV